MFPKSNGFLLLHPSGKEPIESAPPKEAILWKVEGRTFLYITLCQIWSMEIVRLREKLFFWSLVWWTCYMAYLRLIWTDQTKAQWNIWGSNCHTNLTCNLVGKLNYAWRMKSGKHNTDLLSSEPRNLLRLSPRFSAWRHGKQPALIYPPTLL